MRITYSYFARQPEPNVYGRIVITIIAAVAAAATCVCVRCVATSSVYSPIDTCIEIRSAELK